MGDKISFKFECECGEKYLFEVKKRAFDNPQLNASSLTEIIKALKDQIYSNISVRKIE